MFNNFIENHYMMDKTTIKDKLMNQTGGGDTYFNMYIHYFIGIILLVVGIMLIKSYEEWEKTTGIIRGIQLNSDGKSYSMLIEYIVSNTKLLKRVIESGKNNNYKINDEIIIYYDKNEPNIFKIHQFNYKYIGMIVGIIGLCTLGYKLFD
jgi:hypothetical protein